MDGNFGSGGFMQFISGVSHLRDYVERVSGELCSVTRLNSALIGLALGKVN
jgi:hypothetical protein